MLSTPLTCSSIGISNGIGHFLRVGARIGCRHRDRRRRDVGILIDGEEGGHEAAQDDDERQHPGENRPVDEEPREHDVTSHFVARRARLARGIGRPRVRHLHDVCLDGDASADVLQSIDNDAIPGLQAIRHDGQAALLLPQGHVLAFDFVLVVEDIDILQVLIGPDGAADDRQRRIRWADRKADAQNCCPA